MFKLTPSYARAALPRLASTAAVVSALTTGCSTDAVRSLIPSEIECDPGYQVSGTICTPMPGRVSGRLCDVYSGSWLEAIKVSVTLGDPESEDPEQIAVRTDAEGSFVLEDVPAGLHEIRAVGEGYENTFIADLPPAGEITVGATECVAIVGGLRGLACNPAGGVLAGAHASLNDLGRTAVDADADGVFVFPRVIAGSYVLTLKSEEIEIARDVVVSAGEETDAGPAECAPVTEEPDPDPLPATASLFGWACGPELGFLGNATVFFEDRGARFETTSEPDGYFELSDVPPGDHRLYVVVDSNYSINVPVTAVQDTRTEVDFGACGEAWTYSYETSICGTVTENFVIPPLDLIFVVDTTGSMSDPIMNLQNNIVEIYETVSFLVPDSRFAVAHFEDFPQYAASTDIAYRLLQSLTDDTAALQTAVDSLTDSWGFPIGGGGGNIASCMEAVYQAATGEGVDVNNNGNFNELSQGDVPRFNTGWRPGSARIIVLITDAPFRNEEVGDSVPNGAHNGTETIAALVAGNFHVVGIAAGPDTIPDMQTIAFATGSVTEDGFDANADGLFVSDGDIAPYGPLIFRTNDYGQLLGTVGSDVAYAIAAAVEAVLPSKVVVQLGGADAAGLTVSTDPPYYEDLVPGDQACFDVIVSGEVPTGEEPGSKDIRVRIAWEDGTEISSSGVTLAPEPPASP